MVMPKSKRKPKPKHPRIQDSATPSAALPRTDEVLQAQGGLVLSGGEADIACKACETSLPRRARFCSVCGEPQLPGLQRPSPILSAPGSDSSSPAERGLVADAATRTAAQTIVPSTPRVPPSRTFVVGALPMLTTDRPIPASLLQPAAKEAAGAEGVDPAASKPPAEAPSAGPVEPPVADAPPLVTQQPETGLPLEATMHMATAVPPVTQPPPSAAPTPAALQPPAGNPTPRAEPSPTIVQFDPAIEARILALRASLEITGDRFDHLMQAFKPKPRPKAKPAAKPAAGKAKPDAKGKGAGKAPPAKGH